LPSSGGCEHAFELRGCASPRVGATRGGEDRELVAPDPCHVVVGPERLREPVREPSQRLAARGEALVAVEVLERVHVGEQEHERDAGGQPPRDRGLERPRVRQPGERSRPARTRSSASIERLRPANQPMSPPIVT
jgi:hypothetical protein